MKEIIRAVLTEKLTGTKYSQDASPEHSQKIADEIKRRCKCTWQGEGRGKGGGVEAHTHVGRDGWEMGDVVGVCVCYSGMRQSVLVRPAICTCPTCHTRHISERNPSDVIVSLFVLCMYVYYMLQP